MAGCSFATTLMRLTLIGTLDATMERWPSLQYSVVVDDMQMQGIGHSSDLVSSQVQGAAYSRAIAAWLSR